MKLEVFTPTGSGLGSDKYPYGSRLEDLNGKTIGEISNRLWESDRIFPLIRDLLKQRYPDIKFVPYTEFPSGSDRIIDNEDIGGLVKAKGCDAVIGSGAAWGSCSTAVGRALSRIEQNGIPTFTITRQGFAGVVASAFLSAGFAFEACQFEFPSNMFLPGSDLKAIEKNIDKIIYGLTKWKPRANGDAANPAKKVSFKGADTGEAINRMNTIFLKNSWGDGLPLLPATEERVNWILTGIDLPRDSVIGKIMPSGRTATVESLAVNLAMTGGRPEYMPVLIAAMKAFTDPRFLHHMMQTTTCSVNLAAIVNGPIGRQIRVNSGYGCLGPDPRHPAGAAIGRAIRLTQQNVGQAVPGSGTMSAFGGPLKYANAIFAEDEGGLPQGWEPLHVDRGFSKGSNIITIHAVATSTNITAIHASNKETVLLTLHTIARIMGSDYGNIFRSYYENNAPGILILPRGIVQGMVNAGWTKKTIKEFLWENSKFRWSVMRSDPDIFKYYDAQVKQYVPEGEPWPIAIKPDNLMIVVAGGKECEHAYWMRIGCCPTQPISMEIELPKNWDALIKLAQDDLGQLPIL